MMSRTLWFLTAAFAVCGCGQRELREFVSEKDRFKVLMPGTPTSKKQSKSGEEPTTSHEIEFRDGGYCVVCSHLPPSDQPINKALLEKLSDEGMRLMDAKITVTKDVTSGNTAGREAVGHATLNGKPMTVRVRTFMVTDRLYHVMAIGPTPRFVNSDEAHKVLDSFQILP
ncbi:MAG: hypothetical protein U0744_18640 [Gemmataceae bacterium]